MRKQILVSAAAVAAAATLGLAPGVYAQSATVETEVQTGTAPVAPPAGEAIIIERREMNTGSAAEVRTKTETNTNTGVEVQPAPAPELDAEAAVETEVSGHVSKEVSDGEAEVSGEVEKEFDSHDLDEELEAELD